MATVYLHIGLPKTGTTAIQNFLEQNRETLLKKGLCYPDLGYRYPHIGSYRNGHFLNTPYITADQKSTYDRPGNDYEEALDKLAELARTHDKILLTDEAVWSGSTHRADFWPRLKEDMEKRNLELRVIVYFRRQDLWVQSYWAQLIKARRTSLPLYEQIASLKEKNYPMDYYEYLNKLSGFLGKESIIIRIYEKGQYRGKEHTLHSDFLDIFNLSLDDGFSLDKEIYNTAITGNSLELLRIINTLPYSQDEKSLFSRNVLKLNEYNVLSKNTGKFSWFAPEDQKAYLAQFAESNSKVAREYLGREDGILFYDEIEELPQQVIDDKALLQDMICLYGKILIDQQNMIKELKELKKMKEEIKQLREDVLWFRLKRKARHLLSKDS